MYTHHYKIYEIPYGAQNAQTINASCYNVVHVHRCKRSIKSLCPHTKGIEKQSITFTQP